MAGFAPEAVEHIEAALVAVEREPRSARAWGELGMVYDSERQRVLAAECFARAAELDPEEPRWPYHRALALERLGRADEARASIERSLERAPRYAPAHLRRGNLSLALGDLERAEQAFRTAAGLDPAEAAAWLGLARVALQRDRRGEALELLEGLAREHPEDRGVRQLLAVARNETDAAAPVSSQDVVAAEASQRDDPWAQEAEAFDREPDMLAASRWFAAGDFETALRRIEEERARTGDPIETALLRATALKGLGRTEEALAELEPLLAAQPDSVDALVLRARLLEDRGDSRGAIQSLERVCALRPGEGWVFAAKALKLVQLEEHAAAIDAFLRARELGETSSDLDGALGVSLVAVERWSEAREVFSRLVAAHPDRADAWIQLATACVQSGVLEEAERALTSARAAGARRRAVERVQKTLERARRKRANRPEPSQG
jgi:tetratricopeptide (TPR) repeat protein